MQQLCKRLMDIVIAGLALLILSPVLLVIAALVRLKLGSPVIFRQVRPGKKAQPFTMLKFRTMMERRNEKGELLPDEQRLPAFGRFLRSTSMDELPELWNVLRGEMSLVGPRPLLMEYLPRYSKEQARRHEVAPGISGWVQVNGRNGLSWEEKFALDVWYVDNQSFGLDCKILVKTLASVVKRQGVSSEGHVSMPKFMGQGKL